MTNINEIKEKLNSKEYDFLRFNEHLGDNVILLTIGGSHGYGTSVEGSDLDIRGVALNRTKDLIGMGTFEQFVDLETDTTIYSFNKVVKLLLNSNPNVVEMFGLNDEHYLYLSEEGKILRDNIHLFLSQKASDSFGGYANQQLRRLQNSLAKDKYPQQEKEKHILKSIENQMIHFNEHYSKEHGIKLYIDKSQKEDYESEIFMDVTNFRYPLRDFAGVYSEMSNVVKDYSKLNHRNRKKDDLHLNKHAMHLVRLYIMATEILDGEGVNTYRENDRELLLSIRNGEYMKDDGTYKKEFWNLVDDYALKFELSKKNTKLKKLPDMEKIEKLVLDVNRSVILNDK